MDGNSRCAQIVRFGVFEADLETGELRKNGLKVPLQGQPFQVFAILLEHPGELATREELRRKVWPEDTFVDFEHSLNTSIAKIRVALGDDADNPRFVETLPRRGYRFIAPSDKPISPPPSAGTSSDSVARVGTRWKLLGVAVGLIAAVSGIGIWRFARNREGPPLPPIEVVPLASFSGFEYGPAFSPDGNQVAFGLLDKAKPGIYTTVVGGEKSFRLTQNFGDCCPRWSPDGRQLAYSHRTDEEVAIYVTPALGGSQRRVYEGLSNTFSSSLDWSPDGQFLAIAESHGNKDHSWIALLSLADSSTRRLTSPSGQYLDYGPVFSPDGSTVAFVRSIVAGMVSDLYVVPAAGGEPKRMTFEHHTIFGQPSWTPDGRELVFSSDLGGLRGLWRVSASGGTPQRVAGVGAGAACPSVSPRGHELVYQQVYTRTHIELVNLKDATHRQGPATRLMSEKGGQFRPNFSPDGKRIAFESARSGYSEIWACDVDGSNCGQLTTLHGVAGAARWSPDGRTIAFEFHTKEHGEIYLLEVGGGTPRLLSTLPGADNGGPNWSRDGEWLYFYSDRGGGSFQVWKMQLNGGAPVQVTKNGGVFASESADGHYLYYSKFEAPGIWKMPVDGGEESRVLADQGGEGWWNWALTGNGIYYLDRRSGIDKGLKIFDFATGKKVSIFTTEKPLVMGLAVSPDGKSILYPQIDVAESTIMLVKNFR
jgi:Tol biopolymer transport system component/DNA-binding winged helix-turn-helix (wHTH) protein